MEDYNKERIEFIKKRYNLVSHYYGDIVRKLFLVGALIMLVTLPFFNERLPVSVIISLAVIVALGFLAGATNPEKRSVATVNMLISIAAILVFEYYAVEVLRANSIRDPLFWTDQVLALIFLFALYYSTKTLRAMVLESSHR
jgi:hypothetical protein